MVLVTARMNHPPGVHFSGQIVLFQGEMFLSERNKQLLSTGNCFNHKMQVLQYCFGYKNQRKFLT